MVDLELGTRRLDRLAQRLSPHGTCRLWLMYRYELTHEPLPLRQPPALRIELAQACEMDAVAALYHHREPDRAQDWARIYRDRLDGGSLCFVARDEDGEVVSFNWTRLGSAIGAHGVRMHLGDDEIYTTDAYTAPAWRGHGLHPALNRAMLVHARQLGFRVAFTLVRLDNERSAVALPRVGWRHVGSLLHWQPHDSQRSPAWRTCGAIHPMRPDGPEIGAPPAGGMALAPLLERFPEREQIGLRPWSNLYRLSGEDGVAFLKIIAPVQAPLVRLSRLLAEQFASRVAPVIAGSVDPAWLLMGDHTARPIDLDQPPPHARARLLETVAAIQARAACHPPLLAAAPLFETGSAWSRLTEQLCEDGALATLVGLQTAGTARALLVQHHARLQRCSAAAAGLRLTIEHGKLGLDNAAFAADGRCIVTSWNDALTAPAGLSLYRLFGGAVRTLRLFDAACRGVIGAAADADEIAALRSYLESLVTAGYAEQALLQQAMPGAIALGPAARLLALAQIDNDDPAQRLALRTLVADLLAQVCAVAGHLAHRSDDI